MDENFGPEKKIMKFIPHLQEAKRRRVKAFIKNKLVVKGQINDFDYLFKKQLAV
jgi:hypothetical protein